MFLPQRSRRTGSVLCNSLDMLVSHMFFPQTQHSPLGLNRDHGFTTKLLNCTLSNSSDLLTQPLHGSRSISEGLFRFPFCPFTFELWTLCLNQPALGTGCHYSLKVSAALGLGRKGWVIPRRLPVALYTAIGGYPSQYSFPRKVSYSPRERRFQIF